MRDGGRETELNRERQKKRGLCRPVHGKHKRADRMEKWKDQRL